MNVYKRNSRTGGTSTSLDYINGSLLADKDFAMVLADSDDIFSVYELDADSGLTADGIDVIAPLTNAGTKRWIRKLYDLDSVNLSGTPTAPTAAAGTNSTQIATTAFVLTNSGSNYTISGLPLLGNLYGFNVTKTGTSQLTVSIGWCKDSSGFISLGLTADTAVSVPAGILAANTNYVIAIVRLISDGSVTVKIYATEAAMVADVGVTIDAYRYRTFWRTNGSSELYEGGTVANRQVFYNSTYSGGIVVGSVSKYGGGSSTWIYETLDVDLSSFIPVTRVKDIGISVSSVGSSGPDSGYISIVIKNGLGGGTLIGTTTVTIKAGAAYTSTTVATGMVDYVDILI